MRKYNMKRQKILIVSTGFHPQNSPRSFRTTELAVELARQGHQVVVYIPTSDFDYTDFEQMHNLKIKRLGKLSFKPIEIKGNKIIRLLRRLCRRMMSLLLEYPSIELLFKVKSALKLENGYDMLISIAVPYPIHWGVASIWSNKNKIANKWVADCGDPFMGVTADTFRKPFYFKYVEKWFCRKADYITIPFEGARSAYYSEFHNKIKIIPQGFRLDELELPEYKSNGGSPSFAYAGGFIPGKRDPKAMLDFLVTCQKDFKFIVYTSSAGMLMPYKDKLKDKLIIREYIPRIELLKMLSGMDFLVNFDNNTKTQLPSKLIDYAITGRPVFNVTNSTDFNHLLEFMSGNYDSKLQLEPASSYDIKVIAQNFLNLTN